MSLSNALSYLTVLPIPFKKHIPLNLSVHFFPLVGAGIGSLLVLALLGFRTFLPNYLACLAVIALMEASTGGIHLRAVAELVEGKRTYPGSGFSAESNYGWKGIVVAALIFLVTVQGLAHMRLEWQLYAVLLTPILGRSSLALGIIFSRHRLDSAQGPLDQAFKRRQPRALYLTAALLFCMALFPWKVATILTVEYFLIMLLAYRYLNRRMEGLTVQTLGTVATLVEAGFLVTCAGLS